MAIREQRGFTLIELLVVTAIIGIIAGIAIPQYASYRARGVDARVTAAVRHVATGEEAYYASNQSYSGDVTQLPGMVIGDVVITITPGTSGNYTSSFHVHGSHPLAAHDFEWLSDPLPGAPNFITD